VLLCWVALWLDTDVSVDRAASITNPRNVAIQPTWRNNSQNHVFCRRWETLKLRIMNLYGDVTLQPWRWTQHGPPRCWYPPTTLHKKPGILHGSDWSIIILRPLYRRGGSPRGPTIVTFFNVPKTWENLRISGRWGSSQLGCEAVKRWGRIPTFRRTSLSAIFNTTRRHNPVEP
jgi:hypothetical protein